MILFPLRHMILFPTLLLTPDTVMFPTLFLTLDTVIRDALAQARNGLLVDSAVDSEECIVPVYDEESTW